MYDRPHNTQECYKHIKSISTTRPISLRSQGYHLHYNLKIKQNVFIMNKYQIYKKLYSQICIKRSPLGKEKLTKKLYSQICIKRSPLGKEKLSKKLYSQICIKRSPLGKEKLSFKTGDLSFHSYELFYDRTRQMWPFKIGDCLIQVTTWAGLTAF